MKIKLFEYTRHQHPINERFDIIDFEISENDILQHSIYREAYYCFLFIEKGEAEITIDHQKAHVKAPALAVGLPGDPWEWESWKDIEGNFICFDAETIMSGLSDGFTLDPIPFLNPQQRYPFIPLSEGRFKRLQLLVSDMKETLQDFPVNYDLLRAEMWQFIFLAEKEYVANGNKGRKSEKRNHLLEFIRLVNIHYSTHHDTQFYARQMNLTPNYLNKIIKTLLGMSAFEYITGRIMAEAKVQLRLTNVNISQLAYNLGYENPNYFIRCFKKTVGMTPLEYHKRGSL